MWYVLQIAVTLGTAYIWLSKVSHERDVGHALFLGYIVAWFVTAGLSLFLDAMVKLTRVTRTRLARDKSLGLVRDKLRLRR